MEDNEVKKYEIIINSSVNILIGFSLVGIIILGLIIAINQIYSMPKAWNISFLVCILALFLASIIEIIISFWRVGSFDRHNIQKKCKRKTGLVFSSCITYIVFLGTFVMYSLLSIILFH